MVDAIIETKGLTKAFGDLVAVTGLDLRVDAGEVYGLLGPNGAGKTTTVSMLTTLLAPTSGEARVVGRDLARECDAIRSALGYVPQEPCSDRSLSGWENALYWGRLQRLGGKTLRERAEAELRRVGLWEHKDRKVRTYSGGMRKKLDVACGLLHRPRLLVLDEPSLGLDVESRRGLWDHVALLAREGTCIVLCTNAMDEADRLCGRVGIIDKGRLVREGTPADLKAAVGGDLVILEPRAGADEAVARLTARLGAGECGATAVTLTAAALHVAVTSGPAAIPRLVELAHAEGVDLLRVKFQGASLEDAFVAFTGREYAAK